MTTTTTAAAAALLDALAEQAARYQRMETVLQQEKAALIQGNGERVATITVDKKQLIREIEDQDQRCQFQLRDLAEALGLGPEATLATAIDRLPAAQAELLEALRRKLAEQGRSLQYLSQVNAALLHVAIDWLNQSLDTYTQILRSTLGRARPDADAPAFVNVRI